MLAVSQPHWACPCSRHMCLPCPHCSGSRLLHQELSEAGPGLHELPRSKPLRFRYSGSPQRHGLGWACVLCPSQVRAALVTRCWRAWSLQLITSPIPVAQFSGCQPAHLLRWMLTVQNPKKSWLATKPACSLVDNASLGPGLPPSGSGCLSPEGGGLQPASSAQSFVL